MTNLEQIRKVTAVRFTEPVVGVLAKTGITPNALTWLGLLLSIVGAVLIARDSLIPAAVLLIAAGFFDMLDGALARHTGKVTRSGAILDSTLDRLSEAAIFIGILVLFAEDGSLPGIVLVGITLALSQLVSYIRARAEALGIDCRTGLFTRPERIIVLILALLIDQLFIALVIIAFFSLITVIQRLLYTWRRLKN
jgi:CDP-diacylglycerol--glycerol-3-phosphate 3-phosphatidyltransferase